MPPKQQYSQQSQPTWVNYTLTKDDKELMREEFPTNAEVLAALQEMVRGDYRVSFQFDPTQGNYSVFCFPIGTTTVNTGFALAARAGTLENALRGLVFRHFTLFKERWANFVSTRTNDD